MLCSLILYYEMNTDLGVMTLKKRKRTIEH